MTLLLDWPEALAQAGVNVRVLDGWEMPHVRSNADYKWREPDGEPAGMMHHHTASGGYTPNRDKANGYAGLSHNGSERLYQENYGDEENYVPIFTIANAFPAPISSGYGVRRVLDQYVKKNIPFTGRPGPDDTDPKWAGNAHYINIEWVLDGTGSPVDDEVWEMMKVVSVVTNELMSRVNHVWTPDRHVAHGHHTKRKIDLWNATYSDTNVDGFDKTIEALRLEMEMTDTNCPWTNEGPWRTNYPQCSNHYDLDEPIEWGVNTGVCAVPDYGKNATKWAKDEGILILGDNSRDDFSRNLTDGRWWAMESRR